MYYRVADFIGSNKRLPLLASKGDIYFYSPKMKFKFRSRLEAEKFALFVKRAGGDEVVAIKRFKKA